MMPVEDAKQKDDILFNNILQVHKPLQYQFKSSLKIRI